MRFQPVKCNMMQLTRKRINKVHASYTLEGTDLENVESIKYLGVTMKTVSISNAYKIPPHSASVTLQMRSRSLKSNHFFPPSK